MYLKIKKINLILVFIIMCKMCEQAFAVNVIIDNSAIVEELYIGPSFAKKCFHCSVYKRFFFHRYE